MKNSEQMERKITTLSFISNAGNQTIGEGTPQYRIYFEPLNLVQKEYTNSTVNEGQETTEDKILGHLRKYDEVWKALS